MGHNMNEKKIILSLSLSIILMLSFYPNITSKNIDRNIDNVSSKYDNVLKNTIFNIVKYDNGKIVNSKYVKLKIFENFNLINELKSFLSSDLDYEQKFERSLEKLQDYNIIANNVNISDIIDFDNYDSSNLELKNVTNKNFKAHLSPILIVGGGFGLGIGIQEKGIINSFSHFFALVGGLAYVLCIDFTEETMYNIVSFMFPITLGYISGFTGIIIFCVMPGMFYSNLVMLGFAPFTMWIVYPESEEET